MEISTLLASFGGVITALGVKELILWWLNRKSNARIAEADADKAELKNEVDEFHFLRERLEFKDKQLMEKENQFAEKERRFVEQTELVRGLNKQLLDMTMENGKLKAEIAELRAERAMKLCERRGCMERQPQSGY